MMRNDVGHDVDDDVDDDDDHDDAHIRPIVVANLLSIALPLPWVKLVISFGSKDLRLKQL